jgi:hypothetical protein
MSTETLAGVKEWTRLALLIGLAAVLIVTEYYLSTKDD